MKKIKNEEMEDMSLKEYAKILTESMIKDKADNRDEHLKMTARIEVLEEKTDKYAAEVTLTRSQQKMVQSYIKDRVGKLCDEFHLTKSIHTGMVRAIIYSNIYEKFDVSAYADIPREKYEVLLDYIKHQPMDCSKVRRRYEEKMAAKALAEEKGLARRNKKIVSIK